MKHLFTATLYIIISFAAFGQKLEIGGNFAYGLPIGDYNVSATIPLVPIPPSSAMPDAGYGGTIDINYWFSNHIAVGLEAGYISFRSKKTETKINDQNTFFNSSGTSIPLLIKGSYFFFNKAFKPFVEMGIGYILYTPDVTIRQIYRVGQFPFEFKIPVDVPVSTKSHNGLLLSPRAGIAIQLAKNIGLKLSAQYNLAFNEIENEEATADILGQELPFNYSSDASSYLNFQVGVTYVLWNK